MLLIPVDDVSEDVRLLLHQAAVGRCYKSIAYIKSCFDSDEPDAYAIAEAWNEIPRDEQLLLWRSPRKGGVFTTKERDFLRNHLPKG
jgi:hypothetical protein